MKSDGKPFSGLLALKQIVEGTSDSVGQEFFESLVQNLAEILNVSGVWVTEFLEKEHKLRALAFFLNGRFVDEYEYHLKGTPCEPVLENRDICHIPENVIELFPDDPDLRPLNAVSYMGLALRNINGKVLGHLAFLDDKPMKEVPEIFAIFKIFASRATAELRRMDFEKLISESESKLKRLLNGTSDAIVEFNERLEITQVNKAAVEIFDTKSGQLEGQPVNILFDTKSGSEISQAIGDLQTHHAQLHSIRLPDPLTCIYESHRAFPAECTLSRYLHDREYYYTLFIRNIEDHLKTNAELKKLSVEATMLREKVSEEHFDNIIGKSPPILQALKLVNQVASTDSFVLIQGETGTGKELFTQSIHRASARKNRSLVTLNCAALPPELIESELFGHVKGAFTGATSSREGRFFMADKGTLFLDEIGEMPLPLQAKLLRVLQTGEFDPVGSSHTKKVDVRVIAATNRDLVREVSAGNFREDLYYRLNVFPLHIPPLRERGKDILLIADAFIEKISRRMGKTYQQLDTANQNALMTYRWPGNVRELHNLIERGLITSTGDKIDLINLLPGKGVQVKSVSERNIIYTEQELKELEKNNILLALKKAGGKISGQDGAAKLLQVPSTTLTSRMIKLGIK
jgi:PAS domain S-box-containing protein